MIDETAQRMANDGSRFQSYLDVQARFDRYSVGNAVLITAQKADATQLSDFKGWKNNGVILNECIHLRDILLPRGYHHFADALRYFKRF